MLFLIFYLIFILFDLLSAEVKKASNVQEEMERLRKQLKQEQLLKEQAVHKLAEIMNRKDINTNTKAKSKVSSADLRRKEKECRKLQQELTQVLSGVILFSQMQLM